MRFVTSQVFALYVRYAYVIDAVCVRYIRFVCTQYGFYTLNKLCLLFVFGDYGMSLVCIRFVHGLATDNTV